MAEATLHARRAVNLWRAYARKFPPVAKACHLVPDPRLELEDIGGLEAAKDEILTYACAATHPEYYARWGTVAPTGLLLVGPRGSGKNLLARAMATNAGTPFLFVNVSRLLFQMFHAPAMVAPLLDEWAKILIEMPRSTVFFSELDSQLARPTGSERTYSPGGLALDLVLEFLDRTIDQDHMLTLGSTSEPDSLPAPLIEPGRFERLVDVVPVLPDDVIDALKIHAIRAEKQAGRRLFTDIDWRSVVGDGSQISIGEWVRNLHGALRRKARCEAAGEPIDLVTDEDLRSEFERFMKVRRKLPSAPGRYL